MFEDILDFLEPVLNVFSAVVIISLGITLCIGCVMLAVKACGYFKTFAKERFSKAISRWTRRADNIVSRLGEKIGQAIEKSKAPAPVDQRPMMVGEWVTEDGCRMSISGHDGYYRVAFSGPEIHPSITEQDFILRDVQGWLHDDNVYCAESFNLMTLGVNDKVDEIFVAELKRTFHKEEPIKEPDNFCVEDILNGKSMALSEELRKRVMDIVAGKIETGSKLSNTDSDDVNRNIIEG